MKKTSLYGADEIQVFYIIFQKILFYPIYYKNLNSFLHTKVY